MALVGGISVLAGSVLVRLVRFDFDYPELVRNLYRMGVRSMPIVVTTALFTGGIMVIQAAPVFLRVFSTLKPAGTLILTARKNANYCTVAGLIKPPGSLFTV